MNVQIFRFGQICRTWAGTFAVVCLLAGCASHGEMPNIRLASLWPAEQGLSAAAPEAPEPKTVVPEIAKPKLVPVLPPAPPTVAAVPVSDNAQPGPTVQVAPVESESLPAPMPPEAVKPGWMRPQSEMSRDPIRFSAVDTHVTLTPVSDPTVPPDISKASLMETPDMSASMAPGQHAALLVPAGKLGMAMRNAATLAVFDIQRDGFELRPYETGVGTEGVVSAVQKALAHGADILLGPVFASDAQIAKPMARAAGVPMVTFSTDWTLAGNGTYVFGFLPFTQVGRVVGYAGSQGVRRLAILAPTGVYGDAVVETARWQADRYGMDISGVGRYDATPGSLEQAAKRISNFAIRAENLADIRQELQTRPDAQARAYLAQLTDAKGYGPLPCDAVLVAQGGDRMPDVLNALDSVELTAPNVRLLGTGLWDDTSIWAQPALHGAWYAAPAPSLRADFTKRYRETFGESPPRLATLAYDATALAIAASESDNSPAVLQSPDGFIGLDGVFRFRRNGLVERGLPVLEIQKGRPHIVSPAPISFKQAGQ